MSQNGQPQIVDKRKNAQPPAAAGTQGPTVQTSTLPPNPNPGAAPAWAQPAQGARPPVRPLGGGSAVAPAPAAAAPPAGQLTLAEHLTRHQAALAKLDPQQRALLERLPAPTPDVWLGEAPEQGKSSMTDQVFWSLGNASADEARGWFPHVPFPLWAAFVALYMVSGGPAPSLPQNAGQHAAPTEEEVDREARVNRSEGEEEDDPSPEELAAAHDAPLGSTAVGHVEAAGLAAAEAALKDEDRAAGRPPSAGKRMTKQLREQIHSLIAAGGTDEQISEAVSFPAERVAKERKKLDGAASATRTTVVDPAAIVVAGAIFASEPGAASTVGELARTHPEVFASTAKADPAALVRFIGETAFRHLPSNEETTLERLDALVLRLEAELAAYRAFRGTP